MISGAHAGTQLYSQNRDVRIIAVHISSFERITGLEICLGRFYFIDAFHGSTIFLPEA